MCMLTPTLQKKKKNQEAKIHMYTHTLQLYKSKYGPERNTIKSRYPLIKNGTSLMLCNK